MGGGGGGVVGVLGPAESPPPGALLNSRNALKMGCFGTKNGFKNGSKTCFSNNDLRPFGVPKQVK